MNMHEHKARMLFEQGYNCSQSVLGAYSEELGMDFNSLLKISSSFGGGMGKLREVCGALSGAFMAAGALAGYCEIDDVKKQKHYELIQEIGHRFQEEFGSMICRDLLGLKEKESSPVPSKRTANFYKNRPCKNFIGRACFILDEILKKYNK